MGKNKILSEDEVKHIAILAKLTLTEEEIKKFQKQLSEIINYVDQLSQVDTKNVPPTSQVTGLTNVTRKDEPLVSLTQEKSLENTNNKYNGFIKVGAIFNE